MLTFSENKVELIFFVSAALFGYMKVFRKSFVNSQSSSTVKEGSAETNLSVHFHHAGLKQRRPYLPLGILSVV